MTRCAVCGTAVMGLTYDPTVTCAACLTRAGREVARELRAQLAAVTYSNDQRKKLIDHLTSMALRYRRALREISAFECRDDHDASETMCPYRVARAALEES